MILTLPVSHLINKDNYSLMPGIMALEYKEIAPIFGNELERLFHSGYGIVQREFIDYFDSIVDFLNNNNFSVFSFDLGPAAEEVDVQEYYYIALTKSLSEKEIREKVSSNLDYVRRRFRGDIALENLNYFPTSAYSHVCEPNLISEIVQSNDTFMVLDIAHAIISAGNMGIDRYEYLSSLPLDKVIEVHLSAPVKKDDGWRDLHGVPSSKEYEVLSYIKTRLVNEPYLVVEYFKDIARLQEIYKYLNNR